MKRGNAVGALWLLLAGVACLPGCATMQDAQVLQSNMNSLAVRSDGVEKRLQKVERQVQGGGSEADGGRALGLPDLYARMDEMRVQIGTLNGKIEDQTRQIESLKQAASGQPYAPGDDSSSPRITIEQHPSPGAAGTAGQPPMFVSPSTPAAATEASAAAAAHAVPPKSVSPEKAQFDKAFEFFEQGQHENARREFQDLVAKYPASDLASASLFWIGESYFSEKRYVDAVSAYQQILDRYPKAARVPYAMLKQGNALENLGNSTAAKILYENLIDQYPDSPQAQVAARKLKDLH